MAGGGDVGGLVGSNAGSVAGSYTTGIISDTGNRVGGLAGRNQSTGAIRTSYSTARVSGNASVGGLVGEHDGALTAGYATGRVSGSSQGGGWWGGTSSILASYATAYVSGTSDAGGLAGTGTGTGTASYWDTSTSGRTVGAAGRTTAALQSPTGYTGIYSQWNVDLDGDSTVDDHALRLCGLYGAAAVKVLVETLRTGRGTAVQRRSDGLTGRSRALPVNGSLRPAVGRYHTRPPSGRALGAALLRAVRPAPCRGARRVLPASSGPADGPRVLQRSHSARCPPPSRLLPSRLRRRRQRFSRVRTRPDT